MNDYVVSIAARIPESVKNKWSDTGICRTFLVLSLFSSRRVPRKLHGKMVHGKEVLSVCTATLNVGYRMQSLSSITIHGCKRDSRCNDSAGASRCSQETGLEIKNCADDCANNYCVDNANASHGDRNSVNTIFKKEVPRVVGASFVPRVLHNCARRAADELWMDAECCDKNYYHFSSPSRRLHNLRLIRVLA